MANGTSSGLPNAWVVMCKKCACTITCRAIDPQSEHADPDKSEPAPPHPVIVSCSCCWTAFRYSPAEVFKGRPTPSNRCSQHQTVEAGNNQEEKRWNAAILIAASFIAAVRLNKEEIKPSPSVTAKIVDSIRLAEMIQARLHH